MALKITHPKLHIYARPNPYPSETLPMLMPAAGMNLKLLLLPTGPPAG